MKKSQIRYCRCGWTLMFDNILNDPMCEKIDNTEDYTLVTIKRIEWEWNKQY